MPDCDIELPCGCVIAANHGTWDYDLSEVCDEHTWYEAVALVS